jgi:hypothetical protein
MTEFKILYSQFSNLKKSRQGYRFFESFLFNEILNGGKYRQQIVANLSKNKCSIDF